MAKVTEHYTPGWWRVLSQPTPLLDESPYQNSLTRITRQQLLDTIYRPAERMAVEEENHTPTPIVLRHEDLPGLVLPVRIHDIELPAAIETPGGPGPVVRDHAVVDHPFLGAWLSYD